jgi:hypothetical protein
MASGRKYHFSDPRVEDTPARPTVPTPMSVNPSKINGGRQQDDAAIIDRIDTLLAFT